MRVALSLLLAASACGRPDLAPAGASAGADRRDPQPHAPATGRESPGQLKGWQAWTEFPGCTFWLPAESSALPEPISWQPCAGAAEIAGCRQMQTPWSDGQGAAVAVDVGFSIDEHGVPRLLLSRLAMNGSGDQRSYVDWIVGRVDGPLDFALRQPRTSAAPTCWALVGELTPAGFALTLHGDGGRLPDTDVDGLLIGTLGGGQPKLVFRDREPGSSAWALGAERLLRNDYGRVSLHTLDYAQATAVYDPSLNPDRTPFDGKARLFGRDVVFQVANLITASIWAYDERRGAHPLVAYFGDSTRGAGNLGSDGRDLVWTEGEGKPAHREALYTTVSVVTAPYTTDPARLAPRRLRKDLNRGVGSASLQFSVGCGHAGRPIPNGHDVQIVRLRDGAGFRLVGSRDWTWQRVLGFSCEEVFLTVGSRSAPYTIARVPLASLGPPLPAD